MASAARITHTHTGQFDQVTALSQQMLSDQLATLELCQQSEDLRSWSSNMGQIHVLIQGRAARSLPLRHTRGTERLLLRSFLCKGNRGRAGQVCHAKSAARLISGPGRFPWTKLPIRVVVCQLSTETTR